MDSVSGGFIIAILCTALGFVGGIIVSTIWVEKETERKKKRGEGIPEGIVRGRHDPVVRLWRDRKNSHLLTEIGGTVFVEVEALEENAKKNLHGLIKEWSRWAAVPEPVAPVAPAAPVPAPVAVAVAAPIAVSAAMPVKSQPVQVVTPSVDANGSGAPRSMVEEIDAILQEMLETSPLAERSIRVRPNPPVGVIFWVGTERYSAVDDIKDVDARSLIKRAVAEWERRKERV